MYNFEEFLLESYYSDSDRTVLKKRPKFLYHASPEYNDQSIQKNGLKSQTGFNKVHNRIYFTTVYSDAIRLSEELNNYRYGINKDSDWWTFWRITTKYIQSELYIDDRVDPTFGNGKFVYVEDYDIAPKFIEKIQTLRIVDNY